MRVNCCSFHTAAVMEGESDCRCSCLPGWRSGESLHSEGLQWVQRHQFWRSQSCYWLRTEAGKEKIFLVFTYFSSILDGSCKLEFFFCSSTAVEFTTTLTGGTPAGLKKPGTTVSQWAAVSPTSATAPALSLDLVTSTKRYSQKSHLLGIVFSIDGSLLLQTSLLFFLCCFRVVKPLLWRN